MITPKQVGWIAIAFFAALVAVVFQQINTSMVEQGIASGGPYDNAAAFPMGVAIFIVVLLVLQIAAQAIFSQKIVDSDAGSVWASIRRPLIMLLIFAMYLGLLTPLGYHLTTTPMIIAIMWLCGARNPARVLIASLTMSFGLAFIFEVFLNVVLPGGVFGMNIPW